jgi:Gas vesicle synthesis protein GvpL/GvpF
MYLLYCIFHSSEVQRQATLPGVGGRPVFPVAENGISAAISEISATHLTPDVPRVMAYKKVIESFHGDRTVIPMRYGCVLRERPQVIQLLKRHARRYESLLKELDGCVEMGIRLAIGDCRWRMADIKKKSEECAPTGTPHGSSGKNYLNARKAYYAQKEKLTQKLENMVTDYRRAFSGLYVQFKSECSPPEMFQSPITNHQSPINNPLLSLYFLVPGKSIDPFRRVFRHMCRRMETTKLLLSGPWPPYNFVVVDNEQRRSGLPEEEAR